MSAAKPTTLEGIVLQHLEHADTAAKEEILRELRKSRPQDPKPKLHPILKWGAVASAAVALGGGIWWSLGVAASLRDMVTNSQGYGKHLEQEKEVHDALVDRIRSETSAVIQRVESGEAAMLESFMVHEKVDAHPLAAERLKMLRRDVDRLERAGRRRERLRD